MAIKAKDQSILIRGAANPRLTGRAWTALNDDPLIGCPIPSNRLATLSPRNMG